MSDTYRRWEYGEERSLVMLAPMLPMRSLSEIFGRTEESIEWKIRDLRERGEDVPMPARNDQLVRCPRCGRWRTGLGEDGVCVVCSERARADGLGRDYRRELARLAPWQRRSIEHESAREREHSQEWYLFTSTAMTDSVNSRLSTSTMLLIFLITTVLLQLMLKSTDRLTSTQVITHSHQLVQSHTSSSIHV